MTKQYTITLTDAEDKALSTVVFDQNDWIQNVVRERCRVAMEDIVSLEVQRLLSEGKSITGSKDDIVLSAIVETAVERSSRLQQEFLRQQEERQG